MGETATLEESREPRPLPWVAQLSAAQLTAPHPGPASTRLAGLHS